MAYNDKYRYYGVKDLKTDLDISKSSGENVFIKRYPESAGVTYPSNNGETLRVIYTEDDYNYFVEYLNTFSSRKRGAHKCDLTIFDKSIKYEIMCNVIS